MFENEFALDEESAGERLRDLRQEAGFTIEAACKFTSQIASTYRNPRLKISRAL